MQILLDLGGDINSQDMNGLTSLHYAVLNRNENLAKKLIIRGGINLLKIGKIELLMI